MLFKPDIKEQVDKLYISIWENPHLTRVPTPLQLGLRPRHPSPRPLPSNGSV